MIGVDAFDITRSFLFTMKNVLIYESIFDMTDDLTNEEAGLLFKAINDWRKGNEVNFEDRYLKGLWVGILPNLTRLKENYDKKANSNRANGKKGGRPKKDNKEVKAVLTEDDISNDTITPKAPVKTKIEAPTATEQDVNSNDSLLIRLDSSNLTQYQKDRLRMRVEYGYIDDIKKLEVDISEYESDNEEKLIN